MSKQRTRDTLVWGIILIVLGGIFLLETLHVQIWHSIWRLWPLVFVAWGASKLYYGIKELKEQKQAPTTPPADKGHEI
jgi:hypothetical protein